MNNSNSRTIKIRWLSWVDTRSEHSFFCPPVRAQKRINYSLPRRIIKCSLRCINVSTPSCMLLTVFAVFLEQLNPLKSRHGSIFQLVRACMLIMAWRHVIVVHSVCGDGRVTQFASLFILQSLGSCDGAVLSRKSTGDATSNDVTNSVAVVKAILCTVADVRSHTHGTQQIQPAVTCILVKASQFNRRRIWWWRCWMMLNGGWMKDECGGKEKRNEGRKYYEIKMHDKTPFFIQFDSKYKENVRCR